MLARSRARRSHSKSDWFTRVIQWDLKKSLWRLKLVSFILAGYLWCGVCAYRAIFVSIGFDVQKSLTLCIFSMSIDSALHTSAYPAAVITTKDIPTQWDSPMPNRWWDIFGLIRLMKNTPHAATRLLESFSKYNSCNSEFYIWKPQTDLLRTTFTSQFWIEDFQNNISHVEYLRTNSILGSFLMIRLGSMPEMNRRQKNLGFL